MRSLSLIFLIALACGKEGDNRPGSVKYYLERAASSTVANVLILEADGDFKPGFSIKGDGFSADIPAAYLQPFQSRTSLTAETFGVVGVELTLYQENGKPYLTDTLQWKSSGEVPPMPEAYFSELVSADAFAYLVFPDKSSRGKNTTEVFVSGDIESSEGIYLEIPNDDQVLIRLSEGDGIKRVAIKYRNIFGAHSQEIALQIERKGVGPKNCKVLTPALRTATGSIRTRIQADNNGPLYYKVLGDVASERDYQEFFGSIEEYIVLAGGIGTKKIRVKIKDQAGNTCPDVSLAIEYDRSYLQGKVSFEKGLLWTDNPSVTIMPALDHLPGDNIEMHVSGTISPAISTFQWIPYMDRIAIELTPTAGTRHVIVQFRRNGALLSEVASSIFLRPYAILRGAGPAYQIIPGNMLSATDLSISGCQETYDNVAYQESFPCTSAAPGSIFVKYSLIDGTTIERQALP